MSDEGDDPTGSARVELELDTGSGPMVAGLTLPIIEYGPSVSLGVVLSHAIANLETASGGKISAATTLAVALDNFLRVHIDCEENEGERPDALLLALKPLLGE